MRKFLLINFFLISVFAHAQPDKITRKLNEIVNLERKGHSYIGQRLLSTVPDNYDLKYVRCEWYVNPVVDSIRGSITSFFVPTLAGFNEIDFDFSDSLTADSVHYHGIPVSFTHPSGNTLQITLPSVIPQNTPDSITVYYQGKPESNGFGSFVQQLHHGMPVIWTLSEPFGAMDWWPCKQSLNDKIDSIDVIVTTPSAYRAASNGLLISETQNGSIKTYHWQSHYPIAAYLIAIGVTNYYVFSNYLPLNSTDTLEILNYVYPEDSTAGHTQLPDILNVISFYDSLTILYPFANEKYGHCQFGWGGGMEHQTMSFVVIFDHELIAHECAHQWFGDYITCGSWEDIWLNESFATYMEALTEERFFPGNWYMWKFNTINNVTSLPYGSVKCDDTTSVNRIFDGRLSYSKGAYVLHMLRWKLGDAVFFQSIRNYLNDPALAYKYAKTPDLKQHLESTSGLNLTDFFDQWYYNQGYPSYHVEWDQDINTVTVKIDQVQSHSSVTFFEMPVPVHFYGAGIDTMVVFNHTFSGQVFTATLNFTIDSVKFDPDLWILSRQNTVAYNSDLSTDDLVFGNSVIHIFPNPALDEITISCSKTSAPLSEIEVTDVLGHVLIHQNTDLVSHLKINLSGIARGIYFIKAKTGKGSGVERFVRM